MPSKYNRSFNYFDESGVMRTAGLDVYDVLSIFDVRCPATQHAIKKLLCAGGRGHKDAKTDLKEAKESIERALELIQFEGHK